MNPTSSFVRLRAVLQSSSRRIRNFGLRYQCPFCQARLRQFLPCGYDLPVLRTHQVIGGGLRDGRCPVCESMDRERLLYLFLRARTDLFQGSRRLLHVAPETRLSQLLKRTPGVDYLTADLMSAKAMVKMDITAIQYPDASFDSIICNHVLEHIIDDLRAMRELYRVLKPGGWAVLQVPISRTLKQTYEDASITEPAAREQAFGQVDHVRIYEPGGYVERLARCGFQVEVFDWTTNPAAFGGSSNRFGLHPEEPLFFARKLATA